MRASTTQPRRSRLNYSIAAIVIVFCCSLTEKPAWGGPYQQFYGIVHLVPHNNIGTWLIGSRTVTSDEFTEFYAFGGSLAIGSCVRVFVRADRAVKIDAEPMDRCHAPPRPEGLSGTSNDYAGARK
jgi:hypothetical protein